VAEICSEGGCAEAAIVSLAGRSLCRAHYLSYCYDRLESIAESTDAKTQHMTQDEADWASRFLQDCMRSAADIASSQEMPSNLERAQVYDVLLWASELHGRLRRSPRRQVRFPVLLRSEILGRTWEYRTETQVVSRHGMRLTCRGDIRPKDTLTCIRLDNGRRAEATVAWTAAGGEAGETEAGLELPREENFWGLAWGAPSEEEAPKDAT
jgi:PilZ domain